MRLPAALIFFSSLVPSAGGVLGDEAVFMGLRPISQVTSEDVAMGRFSIKKSASR